jgi:HPt (histidine-containing phosphotransfer) domain-containing protein
VDIERLLELTDHNPENLRELAGLYLKQTADQLQQLEAAVKAGAAAQIRQLAHSCAGASATCGVRRLVTLLRTIEHQGLDGRLEETPARLREALAEWDSVRRFLEARLASSPDATPKA